MFKVTFDLEASARMEMIRHGFDPDFSAATDQQTAALKEKAKPTLTAGIRDLRSLLWSSIDNDTSRDLDQIEVAERVPDGIRILVGVADVDSDVPVGSPVDEHAAQETVTVYTAVRNFPMLPEALSTDLTSLGENQDRLAMVVEMVVDSAGSIASSNIYRAMVCNKAQLTYNAVGRGLKDGRGPMRR
jgi:exoribonuclease R